MTSTDAASAPEKRKLWAHLLPMLVFIVLLGAEQRIETAECFALAFRARNFGFIRCKPCFAPRF